MQPTITNVLLLQAHPIISEAAATRTQFSRGSVHFDVFCRTKDSERGHAFRQLHYLAAGITKIAILLTAAYMAYFGPRGEAVARTL